MLAGNDVFVAPGVTIGDGTVVGARTVFLNRFRQMWFAGGIPQW